MGLASFMLVGSGRLSRFWIALCMAAIVAGAVLYHHSVSEPTLPRYNGQGAVQIRGSVEGDPKYDEMLTRISLSAHEIGIEDEWSVVCGVAVIYCRGFAAYGAGDDLLVIGELEAPLLNPDNPDGPTVDDRSIMFSPEIEFMGRGPLAESRGDLSQCLSSVLHEPEGSLAQALLLGIRTRVPESLAQSFRDSGTAHIMAISGLHVAILGGTVLGGAAWLFGRHHPTYLLLCFLGVWLYVLLTGMHCPAYRAGIMFSLFLLALWLGRPYSALPSIALAGALTVLADPQVLWSASFQLSFAAVLGIVLLVPVFQEASVRLLGMTVGAEGRVALVARPALTGIAVALGATVATFPLIAYYFESASLVGIPASLVALPALPGAIVASLLAAVTGLFAPLLAEMVGWVAWLFLAYIVEVVEIFASLPFASAEVHVDGVWVVAYYGLLGGAVWALPSRRRLGGSVSKRVRRVADKLDGIGRLSERVPRKQLAVILGLVLVLLWSAVMGAPEQRLQVTLLDIGEGDAIYISTPSGVQVLVDGGPCPEKICLELGEQLPFWDKSLDMLVLTHRDGDHITGLVEVLRRYDVGRVLETGLAVDSPGYEEWLALIEEKGVERVLAVAGQRIDLGDGIKMDVVHPQDEPLDLETSPVNESSVVLRVSWGEVSFLLTGDVGRETEHDLLYEGYDLESTVLKVGHHGSDSSSSSQFLAAVSPEVAAISAGLDNSFGHPSEDVIARLERVVDPDHIYVTSEAGRVTFTTDGQRLWVEFQASG
jgi:competence protein ComEC